MKKIVFLFFILMMSVSCSASNVNELRENGKHDIYYTDTSLENIYFKLIEKYGECGIPVSNTFIDKNNGKAELSYVITEYGWWLANIRLKEKSNNKTQINIYYEHTRGMLGKFIKIMKYAIENKKGCS